MLTLDGRRSPCVHFVGRRGMIGRSERPATKWQSHLEFNRGGCGTATIRFDARYLDTYTARYRRTKVMTHSTTVSNEAIAPNLCELFVR